MVGIILYKLLHELIALSTETAVCLYGQTHANTKVCGQTNSV